MSLFEDSFGSAVGTLLDASGYTPTLIAGGSGSGSWTPLASQDWVIVQGNRAQNSSTGSNLVRCSAVPPGYSYTVAADIIPVTVETNNGLYCYIISLAQGGSSNYCYAFGFNPDPTSGMRIELFKQHSSQSLYVFINLTSGITAGSTYHLELDTSGTSTSITATGYLSRASDGFYLNSSGTWVSGKTSCLTFTDTDNNMGVGTGGMWAYQYAPTGSPLAATRGCVLDNFIIPSASLASGTASLASSSHTSLGVTVTAATGGTSPYTYQWYRSTTSGFTPGSGNILAGATSASYTDSTVSPGNYYFYKCVVTDAASATSTSNQIAGYCKLAPLSIGGIGDSIMHNTPSGGSDPLTNLCAMVAKFHDVQDVTVLNEAVAGSPTSYWVGANTTAAINTFNAASPVPQYVYIMLGANDAAAASHTPAATYGSNLASICNQLVTAGFKVVLNCPYYIPAGANGGATDETSVGLTVQYQAQVAALWNGTNILKGDTTAYKWFMDNEGEISSDQTHPLAAGAISLASMWFDVYPPAVGNGGPPGMILVMGSQSSGD